MWCTCALRNQTLLHMDAESTSSSSSSSWWSSSSEDDEEFPSQEYPNDPSHYSFEGEEPVFTGSMVSTYECNLNLLQFALKHGLTSAAMDELLKMLSKLLPKSSKIPRNYRSLKQFFARACGETIVLSQEYCDVCYKLIKVPNVKKTKCCKSGTRRFVTVPLKQQLQRIFQGLQHSKLKRINYHYNDGFMFSK